MNREWERFGWSVSVLVDQSGDLERLVTDLQALTAGEDGALVETFEMIGF